MKTRVEVLKFISDHIVRGRGVKIQLDGEELRLQFSGIHHVWHNDREGRIVAVINTMEFTVEMSSIWAEQPVEFYDFKEI